MTPFASKAAVGGASWGSGQQTADAEPATSSWGQNPHEPAAEEARPVGQPGDAAEVSPGNGAAAADPPRDEGYREWPGQERSQATWERDGPGNGAAAADPPRDEGYREWPAQERSQATWERDGGQELQPKAAVGGVSWGSWQQTADAEPAASSWGSGWGGSWGGGGDGSWGEEPPPPPQEVVSSSWGGGGGSWGGGGWGGGGWGGDASPGCASPGGGGWGGSTWGSWAAGGGGSAWGSNQSSPTKSWPSSASPTRSSPSRLEVPGDPASPPAEAPAPRGAPGLSRHEPHAEQQQRGSKEVIDISGTGKEEAGAGDGSGGRQSEEAAAERSPHAGEEWYQKWLRRQETTPPKLAEVEPEWESVQEEHDTKKAYENEEWYQKWLRRQEHKPRKIIYLSGEQADEKRDGEGQAEKKKEEEKDGQGGDAAPAEEPESSSPEKPAYENEEWYQKWLRRSRTHDTSTFQSHTASEITIQGILSNLPCIDRHTETLAGRPGVCCRTSVGSSLTCLWIASCVM